MASVWVDGLGRNFQAALDFIEATTRDCTDALWLANMWTVPEPGAGADIRGPDGKVVIDPEQRHALVQGHGAPWGVTWHVLEVLDAKLPGGFVDWEPWPRFGGRTGADLTTLSAPWSRADLLQYTEYLRQRVAVTLSELTEERAAAVVGRRAESYAAYLMRLPGHAIEHGSQIREFLTAAGVPSSMPYFGFSPK